ncbi:MAG TPA: xanthine dehydrogenase family protein molybdopterin-binding subunit [Nitrososphaerales archaeon]|nr:xanthine dehydrogenase family protein molybdopterin-binding subunit [Nitrososphaerales archaeon]
MTNGSSVGRPIPPEDTVRKVTGTALYTYDWDLPGTLHAKLVTSTMPHAKILSIGFDRAKEVPGVVVILSGKDMPFRVGMYAGDRDLLAIEKVRWAGHPVALVVAESVEAAERASELVDIEYETLPAVFDPIKSIGQDAPILHEAMAEYKHASVFYPVPGTNIANRFRLVHGDVEKGFEQSEEIIEDEFRISHVSHGYLETQNVVAQAFRDGTYEIWTSCQSPFVVRQIVSECLQVPYNRVTVRVPFVGGGFGGKAGLGWEALVALASRAAGYRPVKLVLSRKENFASSASREGVVANVKAGFKKDGRCMAYKVRFVLDAGAYADYTVNVSRAMGYSAEGVYEIPNVYCESLAVYTNKIPTTAMRGFGYSESNWVLEQVFERAAKKLGMDSAKIRRVNLLRPGESHTATGEMVREDVGDPRKVLQAVLEAIDWDGKLEHASEPWKVRARGFALCVKGPSQPPNASSSAIVKFNEDTTIDLLLGTGNFGQGTTTSISQMVADQFGVPVERVRVDPIRDTGKSAYTWQTVGSRGLFTDGVAALRACEDAKTQILDLASQVMRLPKSELEIAEGTVKAKGRPWLTMPLKDLVFGYVYPNGNTVGGPVIGRGSYTSSLNTYLDPQTGQGVPTIFHTFGGTAVDIELDLVTGIIEVSKAVQVFDVGKAINPLLLKMQMDGGFIMGMSIALFEKIKFDEQGWVTNPNFTSYYVARMKDVPKEFVTRFVETPQFDGPMGARGIGEMSMISVASAISNAVFRTIGVKLNNLPMNPEEVWASISAQRPDLLAKAMESYGKLETKVEARR